MMYKHRNMQRCYKKQILLIYIVYLLDRFSNILQNALSLYQDCIKVT